MDRDPGRRRGEIARDRLGPRQRPVDDPDLGDAGLDQRRHDRARRAAGAEHHRRTGRRAPIRARARADFRESRRHRCCVPSRLPSGATMIVLTAPMRRASGSTRSTIDSAACLCGIVRLQPRKPSTGSARSASLQLLRAHRQRHVGAVDPGLVEPETMQHRRARMGDRPAHDPGEPVLPVILIRRSPHRRQRTRGSRRNSSSSSSGRPRIAK